MAGPAGRAACGRGGTRDAADAGDAGRFAATASNGASGSSGGGVSLDEPPQPETTAIKRKVASDLVRTATNHPVPRAHEASQSPRDLLAFRWAGRVEPRKTMALRAHRSLMTLALLVGACSNKPPEELDGPTCEAQSCPFDYSSWSGDSPETKFEEHVLPILQRACNASVCHDQSKPKAGMFLGTCLPGKCPYDTPLTADDRTTIIDKNLLVASKTLPDMQRVVPGDPEHSFIMYKIDGCLDPKLFSTACDVQPGTVDEANPPVCGDPMPRGSDYLCSDERDLLRRWIAQGAQNN